MDDVRDMDDKVVHPIAMMGSISIVDNKGLNWADETPTQGRSCANCCHYGLYADPEADGTDPDGLPFYARALEFKGYCTEGFNIGLFVVNVPNNKLSHRHNMRPDEFDDDALDDRSQGREM